MADHDDIPGADELVAHAAFARRLALGLLGRSADADDVAQDALVLAIERRGGIGNVRAWLAAVVRNLVWTRRRSEARRAVREGRAPEPPSPPSPADSAARLETARRLMAAVRRLEEPYRSTILLRYFDDVSTREIARRYGVPFETVRTRLKRGLARLRTSLGEGDRKNVRHGLLLVAGLSTRSALVAAGAAGSVGLMGATLMGKKIAVAVVALLLLGLGLMAALDPISGSPETDAVERAGRTPATPEEGSPDEATTEDAETPSTPEEPPGPATTDRVIRGRVVGLDPAAPGVVALTFTGFGPWGTSTSKFIRAVAARDGTFAADVGSLFEQGVDVDEVSVIADHPGHMPARARVPIDRLDGVELRLLPSGAALVRVLDDEGSPVEGASVSLHRRPAGDDDRPARIESVMTDGEGRARLRSAENGPHLVVAAIPGRRPAAAEIMLTVRGVIEPETLVLERGVTIAGRVREVSPSGLPLVVEAQRRGGRSWSVGRCLVCFLNGRPELARATADVDGEGLFVLEGLARGSHLLRIESSRRARLHMHVSETHEKTVDAPVEDVELELSTSRITAEVRIDGRPVKKAHLTFFLEGAVSRSTDETGRATVWVVPGSTYEIDASGHGRQRVRRDVVAPPAGEERVEAFDLPPRRIRASIVVTLRPPEGKAAIETCAFGFFDPEDDGLFPQDSRDAKLEGGRFVLRDVPAGRWRLVARPGGRWWMNDGPWLDAETEVLVPGEGSVETTLDVRSGGRLRVVVRDPNGVYLAPRCMVKDAKGLAIDLLFTHRTAGGSSRMRNRMCGKGLNHVDPALPPGEYGMTLTEKGYREKTVQFVIEAGRTRTVEATLEPE
jgi:RNA polymerase sigma-70 factor (ECF subfamily)